jgi:hypothetical protein
VAVLDESVRAFRDIRYPLLLSMMLGFRAEARLATGQVAAAKEAAAEGLTVGEGSGCGWPAAYDRRVLARIAAREGRSDDAVAGLEQAIAGFAASDGRFEAACTQLELARMAHRTGDAGQVATCLRHAFAGFVELRLPARIELVRDLASELGLVFPAAVSGSVES